MMNSNVSDGELTLRLEAYGHDPKNSEVIRARCRATYNRLQSTPNARFRALIKLLETFSANTP